MYICMYIYTYMYIYGLDLFMMLTIFIPFGNANCVFVLRYPVVLVTCCTSYDL